MNQVHISNFVWSVGAAIVLMLCVGMITVAMLIIGRGGDAIQTEDNAGQSAQVDTTPDCFFTAKTERLIVYDAPIAAQSQQKTTVLGSEHYGILRTNGDFYEIRIAEDTGWVHKDAGDRDGSCDHVPKDDTPLTDFPTVCIFSNDADVMLFTEVDLVNQIGTVSPGHYLVEAINTDLNRYYIVPTEGYSGWVGAEGGTVAGAGCESLTATPQ